MIKTGSYIINTFMSHSKFKVIPCNCKVLSYWHLSKYLYPISDTYNPRICNWSQLLLNLKMPKVS